jgi:hypothetical protein
MTSRHLRSIGGHHGNLSIPSSHRSISGHHHNPSFSSNHRRHFTNRSSFPCHCITPSSHSPQLSLGQPIYRRGLAVPHAPNTAQQFTRLLDSGKQGLIACKNEKSNHTEKEKKKTTSKDRNM